MRTEFLGGAYLSRSTPLAAQTLVNLIFEPSVPGSAEQGMFYGTPGLSAFCVLGTGEIRGAKTAGGYTWWVRDQYLYRVDAAGVASYIGSVPGVGRVTLVANDSQLVVMHSLGWHVYTFSSGAYTSIPEAPTTAQGTYQDSYIVFPNSNGTYGWTAIGNATSLDALDFASAEAQPDPIIAVLSDHRELWLFGETTTEIAPTSGDAELVFTRTAMMEHGCAARHSPAKADNTVFWLGRDENGRGVVYRADGYSPSRVSTFALEHAIAGYADISTAFGYCYQQNGHTFYVLTFDEATWMYDIATGRWSQWAYRDPDSGELQRHRGNAYCFIDGKHLVGDYETGTVYRLDLDTYTDNGSPILRERAWSVIEAEGRWIRHETLQLMAEMGVGLGGLSFPEDFDLHDDDGEPIVDEVGEPIREDGAPTMDPVGGDPVVLLSWSDQGAEDGTWSSDRELHLGRLGARRNRAIARRLGISRNRVYRLRMTDPVKVAWYGVNLDAQAANR